MADWCPSTPVMISRDSMRGVSRSLSVEPSSPEDRRRRRAHLALIEGVQLEHAVGALDDLHARGDARARFSATSVSGLIAMPGAISTTSDACRSSGRNPCATVCRKARELRLEDVDERERAQLHCAETQGSPSPCRLARAAEGAPASVARDEILERAREGGPSSSPV